jgi:glycosyltransferase involved in cell wall biosynthesis
VIVDIREEWPDLFVKGVPFTLRPFIKMLLWRDFQMIRKTLRRADGLVAMMESLLAWRLRYAGRQRGSQDRIFWLGDKKTEGNSRSSRPLPFLEELKGKFVVTFLGTFVRNNNPSILLECAKKLRDIPICFVLAGDGELLDEMKRLAAGLPNVLLPGWLQEEELRALLRHSHVGVCPTAQDWEAFPNKTFSYLSAGLPILSAFHGEIEDLIERHGIGFYFPFQDADALAACILKLHEDRVQYEKMADSAKKIFDEIFNADTIYRNYADYIEMMSNLKSEKRT